MPDLRIEVNKNAAGLILGVLAVENVGGTPNNSLKRLKEELTAALREKFSSCTRAELKALHPMDVYITYYRKFGYTYHLLPQLESVAGGKDIPDVLPPVSVMFMAELKNMLLTAGHDLDKITLPLRLARSTGEEMMPALSGKDVATVRDDFMITDAQGVISAILRGCDRRTAITPETKNVIFTTYAPCGINEAPVRQHLDDIEAYIRVFSEAPKTILKDIYFA